MARPSAGLSEQRQDLLAVLVGDAEGLYAQLLLHLQGLKPGRLLVHIGVHQGADTAVDGIHQGVDEFLLQIRPLFHRAQIGSGRCHA